MYLYLIATLLLGAINVIIHIALTAVLYEGKYKQYNLYP